MNDSELFYDKKAEDEAAKEDYEAEVELIIEEEIKAGYFNDIDDVIEHLQENGMLNKFAKNRIERYAEENAFEARDCP